MEQDFSPLHDHLKVTASYCRSKHPNVEVIRIGLPYDPTSHNVLYWGQPYGWIHPNAIYLGLPVPVLPEQIMRAVPITGTAIKTLSEFLTTLPQIQTPTKLKDSQLPCSTNRGIRALHSTWDTRIPSWGIWTQVFIRPVSVLTLWVTTYAQALDSSLAYLNNLHNSHTNNHITTYKKKKVQNPCTKINTLEKKLILWATANSQSQGSSFSYFRSTTGWWFLFFFKG